jgi:hypothetical protein
MRRVVLTIAAVTVAAGITACGTDVAVQIQQETLASPDGTGAGVPNLPVRLLPYDRDAIFDSLAQAAPRPEPQIPPEIAQLQQQVVERQRDWQQAEARWGVVRDSLQRMLTQMRGMDQRTGEYFALFRDFNDLEAEHNRLQARSEQAFREFDTLLRRLNQEAQQIRLERELWADEAYRDVADVIEVRLDRTRATELADTTNANGVARFRNVRSGQWWLHARLDRGYDELYWNVPVQVERGEDIQVRLTEENAEVRQKL